MDSPNSHVALDDVLKALSSIQRRKLLNSLICDSPPNDAEKRYTMVEGGMAMYQHHLPKLVGCGLINWDTEKNRVTKGPNFEAAEGILAYLADDDRILSTKVAV